MQPLNLCGMSVKLLLWLVIGIYGSRHEVYTSPILEEAEGQSDGRDEIRTSRPIQECIFMALDEGHYHLHSTGEQGTCGIYILGEPSKRVVITFDYVNVGCTDGGLVSVVDGWENSGEFFPSVMDHPKSINHRYHEFCGTQKPKKHYLASQNAAMIQYRIPKRGEGFQITIQFIENLTPCNALLQGEQGVYTLRNYGQRVNCSVSAIFPSHVEMVSMNVGVQSKKTSSLEVETGIQHRCSERSSSDYAEIIGSNGMDPTKVTPTFSLCGLESNPRNVFANIFCGTSTVRLVSSGIFENSISVEFRQMDLDDLMAPHVTCEEGL